MKKATVLFFFLIFAGSAVLAEETQKTLSLAIAGIEVLDIDAGAGSLTITGRENAEAIEVRGTIRVTGVRGKDFDAYLKDHLELSLEKRGARAVLVAKFRERGFSLIGRDASIDLEVTAPGRLSLEIDDGSGRIEIEHFAAPIRVDDGSGNIVLKDVSGNVRIDDGSGDIEVVRIVGDIEIDDSSGDIEIREVSGDVLVDDSSGSMTIVHVGGGVTVSDGSGSIDIDDVGGDVRLRSTGSGGVDVTNIKGRVIK